MAKGSGCAGTKMQADDTCLLLRAPLRFVLQRNPEGREDPRLAARRIEWSRLCLAGHCGDAFRRAADYKGAPEEQCDDGNSRDTDGCSKTCQVEPHFWCPPQGGEACVPLPGWRCSTKLRADGS